MLLMLARQMTRLSTDRRDGLCKRGESRRRWQRCGCGRYSLSVCSIFDNLAFSRQFPTDDARTMDTTMTVHDVPADVSLPSISRMQLEPSTRRHSLCE